MGVPSILDPTKRAAESSPVAGLNDMTRYGTACPPVVKTEIVTPHSAARSRNPVKSRIAIDNDILVDIRNPPGVNLIFETVIFQFLGDVFPN
jgi:hypothetical protein